MEIKFFIGPMSKNIVDSIIEFQTESKNKIGLIPSRRQVDFKEATQINGPLRDFQIMQKIY